MYKQDRYDNDNNDNNDMHESILDPMNFPPFSNIKKKNEGGLDEIKAKEVETRSRGKPSSHHGDSPGDSQCAQYSVRDARM